MTDAELQAIRERVANHYPHAYVEDTLTGATEADLLLLLTEVERLRTELNLAERYLRLVAYQVRDYFPGAYGPIGQIGLDAENGARKAREALGEAPS